MPVSSLIEVLRLARAPNLVLAAGGVLAGGWIALRQIVWPPPLVWAALSAVGLGATANVTNDLFDLPADRVNRPERPLVRGTVSPRTAWIVALGAGGLGLAAAGAAGLAVLILGVLAVVVMASYSPMLKPWGPAGNVAVAVVAALPLLYGAVAVGDALAGVLPFALAAALHLAREVAKDADDVAGDMVLSRRTLAARWGTRRARRAAAVLALLFIPLSALPWLVGGYGARYLALAAAADLGVALAAWRLARDRDGAAPALKSAMAFGLVALVAGRV